MAKRVASYKKAVEWIALNDEPTLTNRFDSAEFEEVSGLISVTLTAELFGRTCERVAHDVMVFREKNDNIEVESGDDWGSIGPPS